MANAIAFIHAQQGLHGAGLPALFWAPPACRGCSDPLEDLLVRGASGCYDTSLAILVLIDAGALDEARRLLDIYVDGRYGQNTSAPMDLRAAPSRYNNGAFHPFDEDAYYYFDFTNVHGDWLRWGERWKFWTVHTGPNAWLANAALHYVLALRRRGASAKEQEPYIWHCRKISRAMQRLQDKTALGTFNRLGLVTNHAGLMDPHPARWPWARCTSTAAGCCSPSIRRTRAARGRFPVWAPRESISSGAPTPPIACGAAFARARDGRRRRSRPLAQPIRWPGSALWMDFR